MPYCFSCGMRTDEPSGLCRRCSHDMRLSEDGYRREVARKEEAAHEAALKRRGLRTIP